MTALLKMALGEGVEAEIQQHPAQYLWFRRFFIVVQHQQDKRKEQGEVVLRPGSPIEWVHEIGVKRDSGSKLQEVAELLQKLVFEGWQEYLSK